MSPNAGRGAQPAEGWRAISLHRQQNSTTPRLPPKPTDRRQLMGSACYDLREMTTRVSPRDRAAVLDRPGETIVDLPQRHLTSGSKQ